MNRFMRVVALAGIIAPLLGCAITVVNPATMPALTSSVDNPGRVPYQSHATNINCAGSEGCETTHTTVPSGHRLVIQHVSLRFDTTGNPSALALLSANNNGTVLSSFFVPVNNVQSVQGGAIDQPVLGYLDAGVSPVVGIYLGNGSKVLSFFEATVNGYLLDCTAAPCAPITK
jgi:hypothetical protein